MSLAERLVELRLSRGLSQEQLSERSGVSVRTIGDLERGATRRPHGETLRALAGALDPSPADRADLERLARSRPPASTRRAPGRPPLLPAPMTALVGRDEELGELTALVRRADVRLVTVTGPGGVGKTRLALEAGWRVTGFEQVAGVDLSSLHRADDVPQTLATGLGCRTAGLEPADAVAERIGERRWLLILDSFEHVTGAAADLAELLARCRGLTALVTSRQPLALRGEHLRPLSPLPLPPARDAGPAAVAASPAVALLVERTASVRPGFAVTEGNAADLARLCRRLDGLPLAIELTAAHLRTREPAALLADLAERLPDLSGAVDLPERQQTLRHTVAWSTERLAEPERLLLGVLAVFAGGATPAAARSVLEECGLPATHLEASISVLAGASLVTVSERGGARITMLDTIREVAAGDGPVDRVRDAHAAHFLDLVRQGDADAVDAERDNVRTALDRAVAHRPGLLDVALVRALGGYHVVRAQFSEGHRTLLAAAGAAPDELTRAWALHGAAISANESGRSADAVRLAEAAAALFETAGDTAGRGTALTVLGNAYKFLGRYEEAEASHLGSLELARAAGDDRRVTVALNNLGTLAHDRGDYAGARARYRDSLAIKERLGDARGIAVTRMNLGGVQNDLGEYAAAAQQLEAAVAHLRTAGDPSPTAYALGMLAEARLGLGHADEADAAASEALELARDADYGPGVGLALARRGDVALARGDRAAAVALLTEALEHATGAPEQARTLDRLARAAADPADAARYADRAAHVRRTHRIPVPPAEHPQAGPDQRRADA